MHKLTFKILCNQFEGLLQMNCIPLFARSVYNSCPWTIVWIRVWQFCYIQINRYFKQINTFLCRSYPFLNPTSHHRPLPLCPTATHGTNQCSRRAVDPKPLSTLPTTNSRLHPLGRVATANRPRQPIMAVEHKLRRHGNSQYPPRMKVNKIFIFKNILFLEIYAYDQNQQFNLTMCIFHVECLSFYLQL